MVVAAGFAQATETCQAGPYTVSTTGPVVNAAQTQTTITYVVEGGASDHVAAVVASGSTNCSTASIVSVVGSGQPTGNQSYAPAVGDPVTGLGKLSCHDEAAKINPNGTRAEFTITVTGARGPAPKTVVVKKGSSINKCEIVGIGEVGDAEVVAPVTEIIKEPGSNCAVEFSKDQITGKVLHVQLTPDSDPGCKLHQSSLDNLTLELNDPAICGTQTPCSLGKGKFGEGYAHTGSQSCTTRFIGGRLYSWGDPCPE